MATPTVYPLAATTTLDTNGLPVPLQGGAAIAANGSSRPMEFLGGAGTLFVTGTFGGGTATLEILAPDGVTWLTVGAGTTLTTAGAAGFTAPVRPIRVTLAGATAPSIQAWVLSVPVY